MSDREEYVSYVIDQMIYSSSLDPIKRPNLEIIKEFTRKLEDKYTIKMFNNLKTNESVSIQRHLYITPTYFHFSPGNMLESNKILRKYIKW